jgi:hypothetical protein
MTQRTNARVAGFAFLFYIAVGITQMVLSGPTQADDTAARLALIARHAWRMRLNIVLTLVICATAVVLATALYAITRDEDRNVAVLGLSFRVGEGVLAAFGALTSLGVLWLATLPPRPSPSSSCSSRAGTSPSSRPSSPWEAPRSPGSSSAAGSSRSRSPGSVSSPRSSSSSASRCASSTPSGAPSPS